MTTTEQLEEQIMDWTPVSACLCLETEDDASAATQLSAWSYIVKTHIWRSLQGFYGRNVTALINEELLTNEGEVTQKGKKFTGMK